MKRLLILLPLIIILSFIIGCQCNSDCKVIKDQIELEQKNIALIKKAIKEWNDRNLEFFNEIEDQDNYVYYSSIGNETTLNHEDVLNSLKKMWETFPDIKMHAIDMFAAGDKVVTFMVLKGTHQTEFKGMPATGNKFETGGINIVRIEDGKIVEEWDSTDELGFFMQLGFELQPKAE